MEVEKLAEEVLSPLGYDVLEASLKTNSRSAVLLVRIERKDEIPISVSDLERANRALSTQLDAIEAQAQIKLPEKYLLQVESPGADRPLFTARHFERFIGLKVKIRLEGGSFTGKVGMVRGDEVEFHDKDHIKSLKLGTFKAILAEWPDTPR